MLITATSALHDLSKDESSSVAAIPAISNLGSRPKDSARSWLPIRFPSAMKTRIGIGGVERESESGRIMINSSAWLKNSLTQGPIENKKLEADGTTGMES